MRKVAMKERVMPQGVEHKERVLPTADSEESEPTRLHVLEVSGLLDITNERMSSHRSTAQVAEVFDRLTVTRAGAAWLWGALGDVLGLAPLHVYVFEDMGGCEEWVVASSPEDAGRAYLELMGEGADPLPSDNMSGEWKLLPDDKMLAINGDVGWIEKTCAGWAAGGRRHLCSANY